MSSEALRDGTVQLEVCVALSLEPMRLVELVEWVSESIGRPVYSATIASCLRRAIDMGCCVKTEHGYREPFDALSAMEEPPQSEQTNRPSVPGHNRGGRVA